MPITASAKKSLRVALRRRDENRLVKDHLKQALRKAGKATLPEAFSAIDKAAKVHVIHQNKAARLKSALAKKFGAPSHPREKKASGPTGPEARRATKKSAPGRAGRKSKK